MERVPAHPSLGAVGALHFDQTLLAAASDAQTPRIAAHLAVLHEAAARVGLDVDLHFLTAVRTRHDELVIHVMVAATPAATEPPSAGVRLRAAGNRPDLILYRSRRE